MAESTSKIQSKMNVTGNSLPLEDVMDLLDSGFFDCDEEIIQQVNSLESDLAESSQQKSFHCDVDGCDKVCKTKGGIKRHKSSKHPEIVMAEKQQAEKELDEVAKKRLGPSDIQKLVKESALHLAEDECFPAEFREIFDNFEVSDDKSKKLFEEMKHLILKFKSSNVDSFLEKFRHLAINFLLLDKKRASYLLMMELSNKCVTHLCDKKCTEQIAIKTTLSEKETYVLQYIAGHVVQNLYRKLRKSKHWEKDKFQQSIQLLRSFKINPTETYKLVFSRDRGGLWYVSMDSVIVFEQAEFDFLKKTVGHTTRINYKSLVEGLMKNDIVKLRWRILVDDSNLYVDSDVGKDLLEQMLGLYVRVRSFSYAKGIREKHKLKSKQGKKRSIRNELKMGDEEEP